MKENIKIRENKDVNIYESEYEKISKELDTQFLPLVSVDGEWLVPEKDFTNYTEKVLQLKIVKIDFDDKIKEEENAEYLEYLEMSLPNEIKFK